MYRRRIKGWMKHWDFILIDLLCLHLAYILASGLRLGAWWPYGDRNYQALALVMTVIGVLEAACMNTFKDVLRRGHWMELKKTVLHDLVQLAGVSLYLFSVQSAETYSRIVVYVTVGIYFVFSYLTRLGYKQLLKKHPAKRSMFIVASDDTMEETIRTLKRDGTFREIEIWGAATLDGGEEREIEGVAVRPAEISGIVQKLAQSWVDEVFINLP